jgi:sugar lactone lactonase YvrE
LPDGHLLIASGGDRSFLRREADGTLVTHADTTHLSPRGWNEIVVDGRGNSYINAAGFDLMGGGEFAPDNATLIVADSYAKRLTAFGIGT